MASMPTKQEDVDAYPGIVDGTVRENTPINDMLSLSLEDFNEYFGSLDEEKRIALKAMRAREERRAQGPSQSVAGFGAVQTPFMKLWKFITDSEVTFENNCLSLQHNTLTWIDDVRKILVRESWEELRDIILSGEYKYVELKGKSGRGKSVFVIYLIYFILNRAMENLESNAPKHVANPVIIYVNRNGLIHRVTKNTAELTTSNYYDGDYFFSDNVDITQGNLVSQVCLGVTSGDVSKLKEFRKRKEEAASISIVRYMMSFTIDEMKVLYEGVMNVEEIQFRFDVVGGNPRKFGGFSPPESTNYFNIIQDALNLMFGQDYLPLDGGSQTEKQRLGEWAMKLIQYTLETSDNSDSTDSSLFKDYFTVANNRVTEKYATTFMSFVGGGIASHLQGNINESLKRLFGSTGLGNAFELSCHGLLLNSTCDEHWCLDEKNNAKKLSFGAKNRVLIRNIADIRNLNDGDYGLPTVCNFPLVDAVIKPDIVLQMTISNRHEGAIGRADEIAAAMGINLCEMKMVFVVPLNQIKSFSFPPGLVDKNVSMYLSPGETVTKGVLLQHKPPKKKLLQHTSPERNMSKGSSPSLSSSSSNSKFPSSSSPTRTKKMRTENI